MVEQRQVLALIPARGGSKGIPRKNIRHFAGYPLIAYSIAAGLQAELVTRVIVTTDDEEIAAVARAWGAETPFLRPAGLAQDDTLDLPVFQHALNWLAEHEAYYPDLVVQLRPTSPLRPPTLVDDAIRLILAHPQADSVRGVVPAAQNPYKMWRIDPHSGFMQPLLTLKGIPEPYNAPRQVLPPVVWQTGHIDVIRPQVILQQNTMSGKVILPVLIDNRYTVDIDTPYDWLRYEWLVHHGGLELVSPVRRRPLPDKVAMVVFDFDGVMTDNRVWVNQDGAEMVAAYRSDSLGIHRLRELGVRTLVLSTETNSVVAARCRKLEVPVLQGIEDKGPALVAYLNEQQINPQEVVYVGNDLNDLSCFPLVGCAVVPADAESEVIRQADLVLTRRGGYGAVREICDMIWQRQKSAEQVEIKTSKGVF